MESVPAPQLLQLAEYSRLQRIGETGHFTKLAEKPDNEGSDPILESAMATITQAMVNFDTVTKGRLARVGLSAQTTS